MPEDKKKLKARIERYTEKLRENGLVAVRVWVPKDQAEKLKQYAAKLRGRPSPTH